LGSGLGLWRSPSRGVQAWPRCGLGPLLLRLRPLLLLLRTVRWLRLRPAPCVWPPLASLLPGWRVRLWGCLALALLWAGLRPDRAARGAWRVGLWPCQEWRRSGTPCVQGLPPVRGRPRGLWWLLRPPPRPLLLL
jgi:hypothetical protein